MYLCKSTGLPITVNSGFEGYAKMGDEFKIRLRMTQTFLIPERLSQCQDGALISSLLFNSRPNTKTDISSGNL